MDDLGDNVCPKIRRVSLTADCARAGSRFRLFRFRFSLVNVKPGVEPKVIRGNCDPGVRSQQLAANAEGTIFFLACTDKRILELSYRSAFAFERSSRVEDRANVCLS